MNQKHMMITTKTVKDFFDSFLVENPTLNKVVENITEIKVEQLQSNKFKVIIESKNPSSLIGYRGELIENIKKNMFDYIAKRHNDIILKTEILKHKTNNHEK